MTEQDSTGELESAAEPHRPDGSGGNRPPAANQRADEAPAPGASDDAAPVDSTNPATPALPATGAYRPAAPSGEVSPS